MAGWVVSGRGVEGWTLFGVHYFNRALYSVSLLLTFSFTSFISFSWWCHFHDEPAFHWTLEEKGRGWLSVCITEETMSEGGGGELYREQRRWRTSLVCIINSLATGAAMVSEGPAVSIIAGDSLYWCHCFSSLACVCKLAHSSSEPVQNGIGWEHLAYVMLATVPALVPGIWGKWG